MSNLFKHNQLIKKFKYQIRFSFIWRYILSLISRAEILLADVLAFVVFAPDSLRDHLNIHPFEALVESLLLITLFDHPYDVWWVTWQQGFSYCVCVVRKWGWFENDKFKKHTGHEFQPCRNHSFVYLDFHVFHRVVARVSQHDQFIDVTFAFWHYLNLNQEEEKIHIFTHIVAHVSKEIVGLK